MDQRGKITTETQRLERERAKLAKSVRESMKLILGLRPKGETSLIFLLWGSVALW